MSTASEVILDTGKALLREVGPSVARSLIDLIRVAARSKNPAAVARAALAHATKLSAELELQGAFKAKTALRKKTGL